MFCFLYYKFLKELKPKVFSTLKVLMVRDTHVWNFFQNKAVEVRLEV